MKINWVTTLIAICLSVLITFGFYSFIPIEKDTVLHNVTTVISFIFILMTFVLSLGVSFSEGRTTAVIRTTSFIFLFIGVLSLTLLSYLNSSIPFLVILMGMLFLVYLLIVYALAKAE